MEFVKPLTAVVGVLKSQSGIYFLQKTKKKNCIQSLSIIPILTLILTHCEYIFTVVFISVDNSGLIQCKSEVSAEDIL